MSEKLKISIAGTGNVAWHFGMAFRKANVKIQYFISRDRSRADKIADLFGAKGIDYTETDKCISDIIIICVSDDAIAETARLFKNTSSIILHTSGSTGMEILAPEFKNFGVLYPLQTFTKGIHMDYGKIPFFIEASSESVKKKVHNIAGMISGRVYELDSGKRKSLHVAAVFACNYANHMAAIGSRIIEDAGLDFQVLRPLMQQTLQKLDSMSPLDAQTGPASRGDKKILNNHLEFLSDRPYEKELYNLISESILRYNKINNE